VPQGSAATKGEVVTNIPTSALTSAGLVGGFATARMTKQRYLGGVVAGAAGIIAMEQWRRRAGIGTACALGATYLAALGGSHPLAKKLGAWPSVFTVTAATAAAAHYFGDRRR
jgi:hypothetical protein